MTGLEAKAMISHKGIKFIYIARFMGISRATLYNKLSGESHFTDEEEKKLIDIIGGKAE